MSNRPAETILPPAHGARNEASVLFRADQLAGAPLLAPRARAQSIPSVTGGSDDEGIIDLKALSSAPPGIGASPFGRSAPAVVAPLFSEPPPMAFDIDDAPRSAAKPMGRGKLAAMIAGGLAAVLVLGLGVSVVFKGEERRPSTAAAPAPPPPPPPAVITPAPAATVDAPKVAAADETGPTEDVPKKGKKRKGAKGAAATMKAGGGAKVGKAADPCGCKGEFNCILACSAKGKM